MMFDSMFESQDEFDEEFDEMVSFNFEDDEEFYEEVIAVGSEELELNDPYLTGSPEQECCDTHQRMKEMWNWN